MVPSSPTRRAARGSDRPFRDTGSPLRETPLTLPGHLVTFERMLRPVMLTSRGHIDLLRVASAACRRGR
ncbi:putative leader peptide [Streptomyces spongiae]|uniref:putative leader peptide n=1 Tax=Streptomyces spongiae TaxID=565072 RepID=UPI00389A7CE2